MNIKLFRVGMICIVLWYNYYSYYCALLFCCSQVFVICFVFFFFGSQILLHTWTDWWLVLSNAFLTPVSFYCFLDWRLVLNIAFLTPVSFYCFLDWRLGLNFEHRLSYTSFLLLLSGLKISFGTLPFLHQFPAAAFLNRSEKKNQSQVRWLHITFVSSSC
jgi:hypothetical protein